MTNAPHISFGVIARCHTPEVDRLVDALCTLDLPSSEIVIGVETPHVSSVTERRDERGVRWLDMPRRHGVAYNRNRVLDAVRGEVLVGIDDDCMPSGAWPGPLLDALDDPSIDIAVGGVIIPPAGLLGDAISALGFPAGGAAGFEVMFPVGPDGRTDHVSTVDWAARVKVLREVGGFDESLTYGCEDTDIARRLVAAGRRIVHVPEAMVVHPARSTLREFTRWFYVRGRAERQLARKTDVKLYIRHRLASYGHIIRDHAHEGRVLLIMGLIAGSVVCQQFGFLAETLHPTPAPTDG